MKIENLNKLILGIKQKVNSNKSEEVSTEELNLLIFDKVKNISNWMNFFGILTLISIFISFILMLK